MLNKKNISQYKCSLIRTSAHDYIACILIKSRYVHHLNVTDQLSVITDNCAVDNASWAVNTGRSVRMDTDQVVEFPIAAK